MKYDAEWIKNASKEDLDETLFTIDGQGRDVKKEVYEELIRRLMIEWYKS